MVVVVRTALASVHPCQLYAHTSVPRPSRTQGHHRYPQYLQERLWGEVMLDELFWTDGLCHDSIHDGISWLMGEARKPDPMPSYRALVEARRVVEWYRLAQPLARRAG